MNEKDIKKLSDNIDKCLKNLEPCTKAYSKLSISMSEADIKKTLKELSYNGLNDEWVVASVDNLAKALFVEKGDLFKDDIVPKKRQENSSF